MSIYFVKWKVSATWRLQLEANSSFSFED